VQEVRFAHSPSPGVEGQGRRGERGWVWGPLALVEEGQEEIPAASPTASGAQSSSLWRVLPKGPGPSPAMGLTQPAATVMEANVTGAAIGEGAQPRGHGCGSQSGARGAREADPGTEVISGLKTHLDPNPVSCRSRFSPRQGGCGGRAGSSEQPVPDSPG